MHFEGDVINQFPSLRSIQDKFTNGALNSAKERHMCKPADAYCASIYRHAACPLRQWCTEAG